MNDTPPNQWCAPQNELCSPKTSEFSPPNEWCFPKVLHTTPKGVMLTPKWVVVSKNEGRSSEPNDDPKGANFSLKWVILPQNGCSPQNELYSPKNSPPKWVQCPQRMLSQTSGPSESVSLLKISNFPQNDWICPKMDDTLQKQATTPKLGTLPQNEWQTQKLSNCPTSGSDGSPPVP